MFWNKKSNVTIQNNLKDDLLKKIDKVVYTLSRKKFTDEDDEKRMLDIVENLRDAKNKLDNSVSMDESDITNGVEKVKNDIVKLNVELDGNFIGRIDDAVDTMVMDIQEIVDLQSGVIDSIDKVDSPQKTISKKLQKGYDDVVEYEKVLNANRDRIENEIRAYERDVDELNNKLKKEKNDRIAMNIFKEIKGLKNNITLLSENSKYYASCYELVESIRTYFKELIAVVPLSNVSLEKLIFLNKIKEIRSLIDNPKKLMPILKMIKDDMNKTRTDLGTIEKGMHDTFDLPKEDMDELFAYRESLVEDAKADKEVEDTMDELNQYLTELRKEDK